MTAKKTTFENAMEKLEKIVSELESGELSLEMSVKKYEEGVGLSKLCSEKLDLAEKKITLLKKDPEGDLREAEFSLDE